MSQNSKFQNLSDDCKLKLKKAYKRFDFLEQEIVDKKDQQREIISEVAKEIENAVNKKEVKKIFGFLKKQTTPQEIRDIADVVEGIEEAK